MHELGFLQMKIHKEHSFQEKFKVSPAICYTLAVFSVDLLLLHIFAILLLSQASLSVLVMSLNGEGDNFFFF